ncbi:energy transducer TonB [Bernardetia sp. ABR2-2B]|uniref:energy transducer TonB n=1 Tax=Bernardetia sp. ABR2-2B TaxID=3127472 RepID=UPI0030CE67A9
MTTNSTNFLKTALAILLFSNSILFFYIFKQNSELINLNTKLDLLIKNNFEKQSEKITCVNVFIENEKTQELKTILIDYVKEVGLDTAELIDPPTCNLIAPPREEEVPDCGFFYSILLEAKPKEGIESFYKYISENLNYPALAKRENIKGKVIVSFVIDKNGEITDVKAKNDIGGGCAAEAERVIRNSPKWNPAKQRGKTVKTRLTIPIIFKLEKE